MEKYQVNPVGIINTNEEGTFITLQPEYIPALQGLDGFGHINIIWWFSDFDNEKMINILESPKPYKNGPDIMGTFATRSPLRPNPLALTTAQILNIDYKKGVIHIAYIDANDATPILDIKPYTPSIDRIETAAVPKWCSHWPKNAEASGDFDWENEFNF